MDNISKYHYAMKEHGADTYAVYRCVQDWSRTGLTGTPRDIERVKLAGGLPKYRAHRITAKLDGQPKMQHMNDPVKAWTFYQERIGRA